MKKYIILALAAATMLFAGCNKKEFEPQAPMSGRTVKVSAALDVTKVGTGAEAGKYAWEAGDVIGVWTGEAFTPFTIDAESVNTMVGTFTGTLPEGGTVGYAVYPYSDKDTLDVTTYTSRYCTDNWDYKPTARMYAPATATTSGSTTVASYKFSHLTAYARLTLKNIPEEAGSIFFESNTQLFMLEGQADFSAEYPKMTPVTTCDYAFYQLPERTGLMDLELYVPICLGELKDPKFRFTLFKATPEFAWSDEMDKAVYNHYGYLNTKGMVNRGDLFVLPTVVFEGGVASGVSASIEGGLAWASGSTIGLWDGTSLSPMTLIGGNVAVGEFEGEVPEAATIAVSPYTGMSIDGNILSITNDSSNYPTVPVLWGTVGDPTSSAYLKSIAFKQLGATIIVNLSNIPAASQYVFLECGGQSFFYWEATADLSAEAPELVVTAKGESMFIKLPEHSEDIAKLSVAIPICTGEYGKPSWGFKAECYEKPFDWPTKTSKDARDYSLDFAANGGIHRGDVFEVNLTLEAL